MRTPFLDTGPFDTGRRNRGGRFSGSVRNAPVRLAARAQSVRLGDDREAGMTTAEYAMGTVAACGFSGILYKLVTSDFVLGLLKSVISKAFNLSF